MWRINIMSYINYRFSTSNENGRVFQYFYNNVWWHIIFPNEKKTGTPETLETNFGLIIVLQNYFAVSKWQFPHGFSLFSTKIIKKFNVI